MTEQPPMLPGMPNDPSRPAGPSDSEADPHSPGFSKAELVVGAVAAYKAPLTSSLAATAMLRQETDPIRRGQLTRLRNASLIWWGTSAIAALVALIVVLSIANSRGDTSGQCKGEPDTTDALNITYQSDDNIHWTATYPCTGGGSTTLPIARTDVPGAGR